MRDKPVMMKCGCAAMAVCSKANGIVYDPPIPSCVVHDCLEIDPHPPSLEGRRARCYYFGTGGFRLYECNYRNQTGCTPKRCACELPSDAELPFFTRKPGKDFDDFFCGCAGWD